MKIKHFEGNLKSAMPHLVKEGFRLATIKDVIRLYVEGVINTATGYVTSSAMAFPFIDKGNDDQPRFKLVPYLELLTKVNSEAKPDMAPACEFYITPEEYDSIKAEEFFFSRSDESGIHRERYESDNRTFDYDSLTDILIGDRDLLNKFHDKIKSQIKSQSGVIFGPRMIFRTQADVHTPISNSFCGGCKRGYVKQGIMAPLCIDIRAPDENSGLIRQMAWPGYRVDPNYTFVYTLQIKHIHSESMLLGIKSE